MSLAVTCQLLVLFHVPDFCAAFLCTARCAACAALWDSLPCLLSVAFPVLCCCILWYRLPCAHGLCDTVGAVLAAVLCGAQGAVPQPRVQTADWPRQHWAEPPTVTTHSGRSHQQPPTGTAPQQTEAGQTHRHCDAQGRGSAGAGSGWNAASSASPGLPAPGRAPAAARPQHLSPQAIACPGVRRRGARGCSRRGDSQPAGRGATGRRGALPGGRAAGGGGQVEGCPGGTPSHGAGLCHLRHAQPSSACGRPARQGQEPSVCREEGTGNGWAGVAAGHCSGLSGEHSSLSQGPRWDRRRPRACGYSPGQPAGRMERA